ncbi:MAG: non-ribosomal peptide synthetase, partial [Cyanobacteria bacterium P01_G01_bin.67]
SEEITVVELVPALFTSLLEYTAELPIHSRALPSLKWMMVVGEPVSVSKVNKWLQIYPKIKIVNAYGPTEAADDITQFIVDQPFGENQRTIPIGKPLANLNLYVVDQSMQLLPIGAPGEICVSGIGVGDGYWKNEAKTNASFVSNPFVNQLLEPQNHGVIYKTGDLGRWLPDGNIEFLGRIDHQVKIRGFRIELGEIEACLSQHSNVRENIVVTHREETGNVQLIAYLVAKEESVPTVKELRSFLTEKLPDHMIPSAFIMLKRLPIAPSGKIDRKALPAPEKEASREQEYVAPSNQSEEIIAKIFASVLGMTNVGILDNFFELGGHSLSVTQVISRLRKEFEIEFPLRILFEKPTVAQLARYITTTNQVVEQISRSPIPEAKGRKKITL